MFLEFPAGSLWIWTEKCYIYGCVCAPYHVIKTKLTCDLPIVYHVALDQVSSSQSSHQGKLSSQDSGTHNPGQLPGVLPWTVLTGSLHAQHLYTHKTTMTNTHKSVCMCLCLCVYAPASRLAEEADWCPLPLCPAQLRALCSWCRGPLLLALMPPLGWCSYCCPLTVLDPGQHKRTGMLTQQDNPGIPFGATLPAHRLCRWQPPSWLHVHYSLQCCLPWLSPPGSYWY